jgi:hypothetical protein
VLPNGSVTLSLSLERRMYVIQGKRWKGTTGIFYLQSRSESEAILILF